MKITRARFGEHVSIHPATTETLVFWFGDKHWFIEDGTQASYDDYTYSIPKPAPGPFERCDFGDRDRLSWASHGCAIDQSTQPTYWDARYALWIESELTLVVIDATRPLVMRLDLGALGTANATGWFVHGGRLWMPINRDDVAWVALADLAALFDHAPGPCALEIAEVYPRRRPDSTLEVVIDEVGPAVARGRATAAYKRHVTFPPVPGLAPKLKVTLRDELIYNVFREIEIPGQPRQPLGDEPLLTATSAIAMLQIDEALDPARGLARAVEATPGRQADLDRLFAARVDDPDDPAVHAVIVDLLEAAGEPYAPALQTVLAGGQADTLGPLASYLTKVHAHGGLPWAATLSPTAPLDDEIGDLVAADQRLGFLHTLRLGDGNYNVYAKLVASPRAVGLRHVDGSRLSILAALIAGKRRDLVRLSNVKFATREVNEALADPTFDRVREIGTETAMRNVGSVLAFVIRDEYQIFARTPRHLLLTERGGSDEVLVPEVVAVWDKLPLAGVTVAGIELRRDGSARARVTVSDYLRALVQARFRLE